jgi:3-deoxy-D-manno-octulosonate 8-phosphate phosphatase (KDO 8-P phosphatase)
MSKSTPEIVPDTIAQTMTKSMAGIKSFAGDVDGVLTDGGVGGGTNGEGCKPSHFADIMGLSLARKAGMAIALISGENSPLVDRLANKLGIDDIHKDCKDKSAALRAFSERHGLRLQEVCFMGDDVNDISALNIAGLSACPADARPSVREHCQLVAEMTGGNGAVREIVDRLLASANMAAKPVR